MPAPDLEGAAGACRDSGVLAPLSWLDRLPVWILLAMAGGWLLGRLVPGLMALLSSLQVDHSRCC